MYSETAMKPSVAYNEDSIIVTKASGTINFLMLHIWETMKQGLPSCILIIASKL
jgi:hypothetical protein